MTGKAETITAGRDKIGTVISLPRGHEAYSEVAGYIATFPTIQAARKAVFAAYKAALAKGGGGRK